MKLLLSTFSVAVLTIIFQIALPWWSLAIAGLIAGIVLNQNAFVAFMGGFLGSSLVWGCYSLYIDFSTNSILSEKIAAIFSLNSPLLLVLLSAIVAGIIGGLSCLTANLFRASFN